MRNDSHADDGPLVLQGAQQAIRDAYVDAEAGLFTLNSVPGAGKSVVAHHLAAEDILHRYHAGDSTPEQHVAVISFNRDEAAEIVPKVCDRLQAIVEHDLVPAVSDISADEVRYLQQRLRQAPAIGTVDSLLRSIFEDIAHDLGFSELPAIGNDARIAQVHRDCFDRVKTDPECTQALQALQTAYPDDGYADSVAEMLETALTYCRDQRLSTDAFREKLMGTRDACYPTGLPEEIRDLARAVSKFGGGNAAADHLATAVEPADQSRLLEADHDLYTSWTDRIDDLCTALAVYRSAYRELVRERGVVAHTDVAFLVAAYFDAEQSVPVETTASIDSAHRDRVRRRYHARLQSVIIDEAQDVSAIQHAALAHLVTAETRVFACGDVRQGIYRWRHADPTVFNEATTTGEYLGVTWELHEHQTATTTYRCTPAIAAAINTISEPMFEDGARGNLGDLKTSYPPLDAARDDDATEPAIHLSLFRGTGSPGSPQWVAPDESTGEADMVATHIARGLADGTFCTAGGDPLSITVLFRRRTHMTAYEEAFAEEGLRVHTTGDGLFACPAVETVWALCDWLIDPHSASRTKTLLTDSALDTSVDCDVFAAHAWDIDRLVATDSAAVSAETQRILDELCTLRDRHDVRQRQPASVWIEDIIETLGLRATTITGEHSGSPEQRVANLDALVETVSQWEQETQYTPRDLTRLVEPFRADPSDGPAQPSTADNAADVTFQTIHRAKGDESDVVVIADPGFDIWSGGPHTQRLFTHGPTAGLAPPLTDIGPDDIAIPPYDSGLYDLAARWERDSGLRWGTARWSDTVRDTANRDELLGPEPLTAVAANERAEAWRLLYVGLTRARDHLVLPVSHSNGGTDRPRDRWLDTLRDALEVDGRTNSYTVTPPESDSNCETIAVGVNDVDLFAQQERSRIDEPASAVTVSPPDRNALKPWIPRFVNPSTLYPLTEDPARYLLAHLLGEPLHTDTSEVPDSVPLTFDQLGPDDVGQCLHAVLTTLIDRNVAQGSLCDPASAVRATFADVIDERAPQIDEPERTAMCTFFEDVFASVLDSELWAEVTDPATTVRVEHPIDGVVELEDVEIEIHGQADLIIETSEGDRHVADLKITFAPLCETSRRRYELQVAAYAYLLAQRQPTEGHTRRTVETFGVDRATITSSWPLAVVEQRLARLLEPRSSE